MVWQQALGQVLTKINPIQKAIFGGDDGPGITEQINNNARAYRRLNNVQWSQTINNAKHYGIHPLVAMGSGHSQTPLPTLQNNKTSDTDRMSAFGSGIGRAAEALMTERQRLQNKLLEKQIDGTEIANTKAASDLALRTTGAPPAMMEAMPSRSISASIDNEGVEAAHTPLYKKFKISKNAHLYGLSEQAQEAIEGFGHIGGSALGLAALTGTGPLYMKDAKHWLKRNLKNNPYRSGKKKYWFEKKYQQWKNSRK
jgi:hypothetical protein